MFRPKIQNYRRYREIVRVLVKYGFGEVLDRMKLASRFRIVRRVFFKESARLAQLNYAERIRLAMEELGPTFVKLGQVLASRPFLIPPELVVELSRLQDEVAPADFGLIEKTVQRELGKPIDELFKQFSREPIASASLAQAHLAETLDGKRVAVKVLRPGMEKKLRVDMDILADIAEMLERFLPEAKQYEPVRQVDEFARVTRREVDFYHEARNIEIFRLNFKDDDSIVIPEVLWDLSGTQVLTMTYIDGIKPSRRDVLEREGYDLRELASRGTRIVFKMIFEHGFFHADPHPGNLFVLPGNRWGPVDFGMVGHLSGSSLDLLSDLLLAGTKRSTKAIIRTLSANDLIDEDVDQDLLETEITEFLYRYHRIPLKQINMKSIFNDALNIFTRHRIRAPVSLSLLAKAITTFEEVGRMLDPDLNMIKEIEPYVSKIAMRKFRPDKIGSDLLGLLGSMTDFLSEGPTDLKRLAQKALRGELGLVFRHRGLSKLTNEIDRASNRLSFALIIAAIIIGSSLIMTREIGVKFYGVPIVGIIGYVFAGLLGVWLVISILRSGRF